MSVLRSRPAGFPVDRHSALTKWCAGRDAVDDPSAILELPSVNGGDGCPTVTRFAGAQPEATALSDRAQFVWSDRLVHCIDQPVAAARCPAATGQDQTVDSSSPKRTLTWAGQRASGHSTGDVDSSTGRPLRAGRPPVGVGWRPSAAGQEQAFDLSDSQSALDP